MERKQQNRIETLFTIISFVVGVVIYLGGNVIWLMMESAQRPTTGYTGLFLVLVGIIGLPVTAGYAVLAGAIGGVRFTRAFAETVKRGKGWGQRYLAYGALVGAVPAALLLVVDLSDGAVSTTTLGLDAWILVTSAGAAWLIGMLAITMLINGDA